MAFAVSQISATPKRQPRQLPRLRPAPRRAVGVRPYPSSRAARHTVPRTPSAFVDRLIAGEGAAYEHLFREHTPRMLAVARRYLRRTHDAEDAVQDALLNVVRSITTFKRESSIETWLHRIVVNCALTRLRRQRRKPHITLDESTLRSEADASGRGATLPSAHSVVELKDTHLRLLTAIGHLPRRQRQIMVLRDVDALEMRQIAEVLDIGISTAKVGLHRARRRLKCALASSQILEA